MTTSIALDVILAVALLSYIGYGFRAGLTRSIATILGIVLGAVAAFFLMPLVGSWVPQPILRIIVTVVLGIGLVAAGQVLGATVGKAIRRALARSPLGAIDRVIGGVTMGIVAALVASMIAFSVGALGVPLLSQAISGSVVLRTIDTLTPDPVQALLARLRAAVLQDGLPHIAEALGVGNPGVPNVDTGTPSLTTAAQSVVRITGNAFECGQSQSGSGFVIADDRVVTNAHVVAGVGEPVVEAPGEGALPGVVVYFDPVDDLAIIAVDGLTAPPLVLSPALSRDSVGAVQGYPFGGPFISNPAQVISVATIGVPDIYGTSTSQREVYTIAADVEPGNSGGPLLSQDGTVAGVVFAKGTTENDIGYAMTNTELAPVIAQAESLTGSVSSGACTRG